jgi:hypothetical protein
MDNPKRCTLKGGGEATYEKYMEYCEGKHFKCPWIKGNLSKQEYQMFQMMWGFFK